MRLHGSWSLAVRTLRARGSRRSPRRGRPGFSLPRRRQLCWGEVYSTFTAAAPAPPEPPPVSSPPVRSTASTESQLFDMDATTRPHASCGPCDLSSRSQCLASVPRNKCASCASLLPQSACSWLRTSIHSQTPHTSLSWVLFLLGLGARKDCKAHPPPFIRAPGEVPESSSVVSARADRVAGAFI